MLALALVLLCLAAAQPARADSPPVEISQFSTERTADGVFLTANVRFELPSNVEDALIKGVPMFFVAEVNIARERWYWLNSTAIAARRHIRLSYQPVTRRWRLTISSGVITPSSAAGAFSQSFDTLTDALSAAQRLSRWRIGEATDIDSDQKYKLDFRFHLDVTQLPRPFQIGVLGQADWIISADISQRLQFEAIPK